jgi:hypothetical protein
LVTVDLKKIACFVWQAIDCCTVHLSFEFDETVYSKKGHKVDIYNKTLTQFRPYDIEWLYCSAGYQGIHLEAKTRTNVSPNS